MKKTICAILAAVIVLSVNTAALGESTGTFSTPITAAFCSGQADRYAFWTGTEEQRALLAILVAEDMCRQDYSAYNACFPVTDLSCVLYNPGAHTDNRIQVYYMCADAYLLVDYYPDTNTASFRIDRQMPDDVYFTEYYIQSRNNGFHQAVQLNYTYPADFPEGTAAFFRAMKQWLRYYEQHPELALPAGLND